MDVDHFESYSHDELYRYIRRENVWQSLLASLRNPKLDRPSATALGREVVHRSKTDLYWMAKYFLWESNPAGADRPIEDNRVNERVHGPICKIFVQKDPNKSIGDQDWRKERVILYPRGSFKSTIDICDTVQWVLCFPDIRILYLTADETLATGFVDETKGHFVIREDEDRPSLMNVFFPEYCVAEKDLGASGAFTCPIWARKQIKRKEPTVLAESIISTLSGKHFEVVKADDSVSNKNSETEEQCKKITSKFHLNRKMLLPFGYVDKIGTRYADEDMYGEDLEKNVGEVRRESGKGWEYIENQTTGLQILIGRAVTIKPEVLEKLQKENRPLTYQEAGEEGCDLLFPEHLTWSFLMNEFSKDEASFEGQYNQNPRPASRTTFDLPLLQRHTVPFNHLPVSGPISQTWDFAFSKKKGRDYSTGSTAIWNDKASFYALDLIRNRFKPKDLAKAVVDWAVKWRPFVIGIEDAAGSRFLEPTIISEAEKTGIADVIAVCSKIDWITPDNQKDAKQMRMSALHPWLMDDRMWFASHMPFLDIAYTEFQRCLTSHHHDDIPDVLSQQPRYAPRMQKLIANKEIQTYSRSDASWNLLFEENCDAFGRIGMGWTQPIDIIPVPEDVVRAEPSAPGLDPILGSLCG